MSGPPCLQHADIPVPRAVVVVTSAMSGRRGRPLALIASGALAAAVYAGCLPVANAYDRTDAGYVTASKNKAVLDYVVCLEREVGNAPRRLSIPEALDRAERSCGRLARKLPKDGSEPTAFDLRMGIMECGFEPGDASPGMDCSQ